MKKMYNPPHPGEMLTEFMGDMTVTQLAANLNVTRPALSKIVNCKASISPVMAEKLAVAFPCTTPDTWLIWQNRYDLWQLEHDKKKLAGIIRNVTPDVLKRVKSGE